MSLKQKEIVLLPYPFSNLKERKVRPAVVISNDLFNKKSKDCIMVPLTGVIKEEPYSIIISNENLVSGNLIKISRIKVDKIFNIEKNLTIAKIGIINNQTLKDIKSELSKMF